MQYDEAISDCVIQLVSEGWALSAIAQLPGMPGMYQMKQWEVIHPEFKESMKIARAARAEMLSDASLRIADHTNSGTHLRDRLKIETAMKIASAIDPDVYGSKTKISGDPNAPVTFLISTGVTRLQEEKEPIEIKLDKSDPAKMTEKDPIKDQNEEDDSKLGPGKGFGT